MRFLLTTIVFTAAASLAPAQQSAYQSGDGKTSLYLDSSAAVLNFTDTKLSVGYTDRHSQRPLFWGFELFGKASSGITTLLVQKIKVPEGGGDFSVGKYHLFSGGALSTSKIVDDWLLLDVGYSRSAFYAESSPGPISASKRYFDRYRAFVDYNALLSGTVIFGLAAGAERRNNLDDLTQATFQTTIAPAPAGSSNSVIKTQAGYYGNYRQYVAAPLYTDLLVLLPSVKAPILKAPIAIDGFTRSDLAKVNRSYDGGIGVFVTKDPKTPTKVLGGVAASWNGGKVRIALIAGLNF